MKKMLFPFKLLGQGSADVESLASYIHRISFEHGVYVGELLRFIYYHGSSEAEMKTELVTIPNYVTVKDLLRPNRLTKTIVTLLRVMSGNSTLDGILNCLDGAVGYSPNLVEKGFKWCPECFKEAELLDEHCYFKLIWHLKDITACPIHRTPLVTKCEYCGCNQVTYKKKYPIGICQRCGISLSKRKESLTPHQIVNSWELSGVDLVKFFNDIAAYPDIELEPRGAIKSLEAIFNYFWHQNREDELFRALPRDKILSAIEGQSNISLKSARRYAYLMGVPLIDFLSGNACMGSESLDFEWSCEVEPSFMHVSKKSQRDHLKVVNKMKSLIRKSPVPLSLKEVARKLDVSVGYIEYRHPVIKDSIVREHKKYVENIQIKKRQQALSAALSFFSGKKYDQYNKSRKEAYRVLREETGLPKWTLKEAISEAYNLFNS